MNDSAEEFYFHLKERLSLETGLGTEYSISPHDFKSLILEPKVISLLKAWLGISIRTHGKEIEAILPDNEKIDLNELYKRVELDRKMRFDIYQIGMSIWR